ARAQLDEMKESLDNEYLTRSNQLESQYREKMSRMEPELVETITALFEKVVHVISEDNSQLVIDLINNAMHNMDTGNSFLIRVSPDDYPFVVNHQGKIYCAMSKDIQIEIFEDASLQKNQCRIESEFGVYDCSLDIQMGNLIRDIKLMSSLS
ncbi:MAG: FliH/SctL family protein, partial [Lachnospiraceae bacterium]